MPHRYPPPPTPEELGLVPARAAGGRRSGDELARMKKFRFQLLAAWIAERYPPCLVADVGGGKGLLAWLLVEAGFRAEVIDPVDQPLPSRYRDLAGGRRVRLDAGAAVPRRRRTAFRPELGRRYDLLVALHAHGANLAVLETAAAAGSSCVVLPCCVVDEPAAPPPGRNWFLWLVDQARDLGLEPEPFALNFRGQSVGFAVRGPRPAAP